MFPAGHVKEKYGQIVTYITSVKPNYIFSLTEVVPNRKSQLFVPNSCRGFTVSLIWSTCIIFCRPSFLSPLFSHAFSSTPFNSSVYTLFIYSSKCGLLLFKLQLQLSTLLIVPVVKSFSCQTWNMWSGVKFLVSGIANWGELYFYLYFTIIKLNI